jgi:hypothetical protein
LKKLLRFGWLTFEQSIFSLAETIASGVLIAIIVPVCERSLRSYYTRNQPPNVEAALPSTATSPLLGSTSASSSASHSRSTTLVSEDEASQIKSDPSGIDKIKVNDALEKQEALYKRKITVQLHGKLLIFSLVGALLGCVIYALAEDGRVWFAGK